MPKPKAFNNDICCCCGEYVPEGRQVCHECEKKTENRLKVSEALMIGVDIGQGDDISVLQAGSHGKYIAKVHVIFDADSKRCTAVKELDGITVTETYTIQR